MHSKPVPFGALGFKSLPWRDVQRFKSSSHTLKIVGTGIERSMPRDYFHMGEYRLVKELEKVNALPQPNRDYAVAFKDYMEANNRKANMERSCSYSPRISPIQHSAMA
jgi:hypothetical protein